MYYVLDDKITIKKWKGGRTAYTISGIPKLLHLSEEEYSLLKRCDGETDLVPTDTLRVFEMLRVIVRCEKGKCRPKPGQIREYSNYHFRNIDWTITERCNYNCLHCFQAADNGRRHREEFSKEEAFRLLEEAERCGISGIRLTGGEPTMYPFFKDVVEEIRARGLYLLTLITNGSLLDEELIGFVKEIHPEAQIMLSFDGIGTHDWLRQQKGSEKQVISAIKLCKKAGFYVRINMNVNRRNRNVVYDSAKMLADLGVDKIRMIKTTEAPRWRQNAADESLTIDEYYDLSADFARRYKEEGMQVPVTIWQSLYLDGAGKRFSMLPVKASACKMNENATICSAMITKISVQPNGNIIPCAPLAGLYTLLGVEMENVKRDGLQKVLTEGLLVDQVLKTVREKRAFKAKCSNCRFFENCQGGCAALSMLFGGNLLAPDDYKCAFFENGYYEKYLKALEGWNNIKPM